MESISSHLTSPFSLELRERRCLDHSPDWLGLIRAWSQKGPLAFLESAGVVNGSSRWSVLAGGARGEYYEQSGKIWSNGKTGIEESSLTLFQFLREVGKSQTPFLPPPYCFAGAWFGILSYEAGLTIPPLKIANSGETKTSIPAFSFFKPKRLLAFDRMTKELFLFGELDLDVEKEGKPPVAAFQVGPLEPQLSKEAYQDMVVRAKAYISSGDIYQANLAQSFRAPWKGDSVGLYGLLREINPGPFMGYFRGNGFTVVSSSPERLVLGEGDRLETKPIAGTRKRGSDETQDLQMIWELKTSPKEQAEHLMLVDLARNDLGRVSRFGTVEVKGFAEVESFSKVHHLVSTVRAYRKEAITAAEILQALFPGGTITGCPKIRCMEIIQELEGKPRGFYTGGMGYVGPGPCLDLNILIRTITLSDGGWLEFFAGAGIVADSDPEKEYLETLYKVEALAQALGTSLLTDL
jgi:anthranilate/para-aminobenzoate synthase component I